MTEPRLRFGRIVAALVLVAVLALLLARCPFVDPIDRCLDRGGAWDAEQSRCVLERS